MAVSLCLAASAGAARKPHDVHLPTHVAHDTEIGLALLGQKTLYATYWSKAGHDGLWQLSVYALDVAARKTIASIRLDQEQPLRTPNDAHVIQDPAHLFTSPDGRLLLCDTTERAKVHKIWVLDAKDLHVVSARTLTRHALKWDDTVVGFAADGDVRLLNTPGGATLHLRVKTATVTDLDPRALEKVIRKTVIHFQETAWYLISVGPGDLLWAVDERRAKTTGDPRITAYSLRTGKPLATSEVRLSRARVGVPNPGPRPHHQTLPPPTGIPLPGGPDNEPQLAQIIAVDGAVLAVLNQSAKDWAEWSRVVRLGVHSTRETISPVINGCDLNLNGLGRHGRIAFGTCDLFVTSHFLMFERYNLKKSEALFLTTAGASIIAVNPLNRFLRPAISCAVDDSADPAVAAIYDHSGKVRFLLLPREKETRLR